MDIELIKKLCKGLGVIKKFSKNYEFFGNVELEIETPHKTVLSIISDRGIFSCYVVKKTILHNRLVPVDRIIKCNKNATFNSLEATIDYLKNHLEKIEEN